MENVNTLTAAKLKVRVMVFNTTFCIKYLRFHYMQYTFLLLNFSPIVVIVLKPSSGTVSENIRKLAKVHKGYGSAAS